MPAKLDYKLTEREIKIQQQKKELLKLYNDND